MRRLPCCCQRLPRSHCKRRCWSDTIELPLRQVLTAEFAVAGLVKTAAAAAIAFVLLGWRERAPVPPLLALALIELAAATLTTHAAARLDSRGALLAVEGLHQLGAAIWIGGIPCFLLALAELARRRRDCGWSGPGSPACRWSVSSASWSAAPP